MNPEKVKVTEREALLTALNSIAGELGNSLTVATELTGPVAKEEDVKKDPCCKLDEIDDLVEVINYQAACLYEHLSQIASRLS